MSLLASILGSLMLFVSGLFGHAPTAGSYNPTGGGTYRLATSIGTSNTSITLSSFKEPISNILYTMSYLNTSIEYGTIEPQSNNREFVSFTGITQNADGTATLTGVTRGISSSFPFTASTTLQLAHPGQSIFILSNSPAFYANQFLMANQVSTSTVGTVFSSTTPPHYDFNPTFVNVASTSFASKGYVDNSTTAGGSPLSNTVAGIGMLATALQQASSTATGVYNAITYNMLLASANATDTPQYGCAAGYTGTAGAACTIIADLTGHIKQAWIDLTKSFTFSGPVTFSNTVNIPASVANPLTLNGVAWTTPPADTASSTEWMSNGAGKLFERVPFDRTIKVNPAVIQSSSNTSTTTVYTVVIPANTVNALYNQLKVSASFATNTSGGSVCYGETAFGNGSASSTVGFVRMNVANTGYLTNSMYATTTSSQIWQSNGQENSNGQFFASDSRYTGSKYTSTSLSTQSYIGFSVRASSGSETCTLNGVTVEVLSE